jgi:hypothetical protein
MPRVRLETMIPTFENAKIFNVSDRAATVIGSIQTRLNQYFEMTSCLFMI